ncbi:MAG: hypothetical protein ACI4F1_07595 [Bariatricus sp.]
MISLTFGEQVKIVLSRKGMTIKELAEQIEERTGKKMSRQNLTQRLGRDNFQEQDMRMIADILGCSFQLSILASQEAAERASVIEEVPPTSKELDKLAAKKERKAARAEAKEAERDITVGEIVDMLEEPQESASEAAAVEEPAVQEVADTTVDTEPEEAVEAISEPEEEKTGEDESVEKTEGVEEQAAYEPEADTIEEVPEEPTSEEPAAEVPAAEERIPEAVVEETTDVQPEVKQEEAAKEETAKNEHKESRFSRITKIISSPKREEKRHDKAKDFQPIKKRADEDEDLVNGDVNPYTGHEYQSNSVRMHPKRIGYVQVYDRKEHKWTDMTEWAFLGFEERKKATLGKDYEPPIYLD